ncbi:nicotinate phosphoribosyltransferase [Leptolyngbya sp. FACHB-36]|uniref:nicotinate phosphoribosyltransferase n=1 Tax=Leptolyngbya sp. FACHB-36 TaxID=2692808 RepID=UPI00168157C6|nr:nicotinate phosphoribosyltransferase [Leptolyngbya sp. FACHB-36]MBD2020898.1 nicotinate phosphoribosyltransferase [Leptolyngbya sp. FACHB-36]
MHSLTNVYSFTYSCNSSTVYTPITPVSPILPQSFVPSVTELDRSFQPSEDQALTIGPEDYSLLTDLYQLTMTACYVGEGLDQRRASFELFARRLPQNFGYLVAMGLAQALEYLVNFRFTPQQIDALRSTGIFAHADDRFWTLLADAQFRGDVWAVPEGTVVFANEPLLRIEAPLWQAQLVETYLLNTLNYQTLIATRAARLRDVAGPDATLFEFGTRRAFSPQGSLWAARAALAGGLDATSNVLAALKLGRKPTGTMAHSLVMALAATAGSEAQAFTAFHRYFPGAPLLIDTYDTIAAADHLAEKRQAGLQLAGVRIDSGDLVTLSKQVRQRLPDIPIFASGDLDEYKIAEFNAAEACIDGYGLGTQLVTGTPVNGVYKLVEIDGTPVMKESTGKVTYPGRKQIFRQAEAGVIWGDRLGLIDEEKREGEPLLQLVMQQGQQVKPTESLEAIAQRTAHSVAALPPTTRQLHTPISLPVELSSTLQTLIHRTQHTR